MHFCMPNIINAMYTQQVREVILPSVQNILGICKQITILIFYYISSRFELFLNSFIPLYKTVILLFLMCFSA